MDEAKEDENDVPEDGGDGDLEDQDDVPESDDEQSKPYSVQTGCGDKTSF